jgi:polyhydroxybutyrate depolymerase
VGAAGTGSSVGATAGDASKPPVAVAGAGGALSSAGATAAGSGGMSAAGSAGSATSGTGGSEPATCPAGATLKAGETNETVMVGGVARTYILHVPQSYTGKTAVPLVTDWHPILAQNTFEKGNSGYLALSDSEGFIVAFPSGIDNAWNVGLCCTTSRTVDDLGFAKAMVAAIKAKGCVDPKRVYAVGYSMGGGMSQYLACNAADIFASIAPAAFDLFTEDEEPCHPTRPISIMQFRSTGDPVVPYTGGASMPPNGLNVTNHFLGAMANFMKWSQLDGCTGMPAAAAAGAGCQTYTECKEGTEVTLCTKQGGGHDTGDAKLGWSFLKKHPMP